MLLKTGIKPNQPTGYNTTNSKGEKYFKSAQESWPVNVFFCLAINMYMYIFFEEACVSRNKVCECDPCEKRMWHVQRLSCLTKVLLYGMRAIMTREDIGDIWTDTVLDLPREMSGNVDWREHRILLGAELSPLVDDRPFFGLTPYVVVVTVMALFHFW